MTTIYEIPALCQTLNLVLLYVHILIFITNWKIFITIPFFKMWVINSQDRPPWKPVDQAKLSLVDYYNKGEHHLDLVLVPS